MNKDTERVEITQTIEAIVAGINPVGLTIDWPTVRVEPGSSDRRTQILGESGFDLAQFKDWEPGDRVDGKASARTGWRQIVSALFEEPRDLTIWVIVDRSKSMVFGTQNMNEQTLAATLMGRTIGAASRDDLAGVMIYDENNLREVLAPKSAPGQLLPALYTYLDPDFDDTDPEIASEASGLTQALARLPHRQRCLVFLISPLHGLSKEEQEALETTGAVHDLICLTVGDPRERDLPDGFGWRTLRDLKTGETASVWLSAGSRARWRAEFEAERKRLVQLIASAGACSEQFFTSDDSDEIERKLVPIFTGARNQE